MDVLFLTDAGGRSLADFQRDHPRLSVTGLVTAKLSPNFGPIMEKLDDMVEQEHMDQEAYRQLAQELTFARVNDPENRIKYATPVLKLCAEIERLEAENNRLRQHQAADKLSKLRTTVLDLAGECIALRKRCAEARVDVDDFEEIVKVKHVYDELLLHPKGRKLVRSLERAHTVSAAEGRDRVRDRMQRKLPVPDPNNRRLNASISSMTTAVQGKWEEVIALAEAGDLKRARDVMRLLA